MLNSLLLQPLQLFVSTHNGTEFVANRSLFLLTVSLGAPIPILSGIIGCHVITTFPVVLVQYIELEMSLHAQLAIIPVFSQPFPLYTKLQLMWHWWESGPWNPPCFYLTQLGFVALSLLIFRLKKSSRWAILYMGLPPMKALLYLAICVALITDHQLLLEYLITATLLCCLCCFPMSMGLSQSC